MQSSPQENVWQNINNSLCSKVELRCHFQVTFRDSGCSADRVWRRTDRSRLVEPLRINIGLWKLLWIQSLDVEIPKLVKVISKNSTKSRAKVLAEKSQKARDSCSSRSARWGTVRLTGETSVVLVFKSQSLCLNWVWLCSLLASTNTALPDPALFLACELGLHFSWSEKVFLLYPHATVSL